MPEPSFQDFPEYDWIGVDRRTDPDTFVWLANLSAVFRALFLPTGKLDFPVGSFASPIGSDDRPPAGRDRLMRVDGVLSFVDSAGAVTPIDINTFLGLLDTPSTFVGAALQAVRVNAAETGLEFAAGGGGGLKPVREMPSVNFFNNTAVPAAYRLTAISYGALGVLRESRDAPDFVTNLPAPTFGVERVDGPATGHQTSYFDAAVVDDPLSFGYFIHWRVPDDWVGGFAINAIRINTKAANVPVGNGGITFSLTVYHPDTGVVVTTQTRLAVATETAYTFLVVTAAQLVAVGVGLWAGSLLKIKIRAITNGSFDFGANTARFGEIEINPA